MRIEPVFARVDIDLDGHVERQRIDHLFLDERAHRRFLVQRHLEDEFVVDLEEQAALQPLGIIQGKTNKPPLRRTGRPPDGFDYPNKVEVRPPNSGNKRGTMVSRLLRALTFTWSNSSNALRSLL